ncbi:hypothetical protein A0H76_1450 [Hepatospora eriocheir]|uniref:Uncharacterized protein n=1 Tax=Hepatospora eriocheir TaxID=1081669 RepID=A0A1X0QH10_9MICR|nr:hypothetical protein A0H76_1450 [Hepatospora eriocheir]
MDQISSKENRKLLNDGPRFTKLKQLFKKTIDETFNPLYYDQPISNEVYNIVQSKLSAVFKNKIGEYHLEMLLNRLDMDISNKRVSYKDITDENYIKEIFESIIVDKKIGMINALDLAKKQLKSDIKELNKMRETLEKDIQKLNKENRTSEIEYENILNLE